MARYFVGLVGENNYQNAISRLAAGMRVGLEHEASNPHDPNAIVAFLRSGDVIGYVPKEHWLKRAMIEEEKSVIACVRQVTGGVKGRQTRGVVLAVFLGEDAEQEMALLIKEIRKEFLLRYGPPTAVVLAILIAVGVAALL